MFCRNRALDRFKGLVNRRLNTFALCSAVAAHGDRKVQVTVTHVSQYKVFRRVKTRCESCIHRVHITRHLGQSEAHIEQKDRRELKGLGNIIPKPPELIGLLARLRHHRVHNEFGLKGLLKNGFELFLGSTHRFNQDVVGGVVLKGALVWRWWLGYQLVKVLPHHFKGREVARKAAVELL